MKRGKLQRKTPLERATAPLSRSKPLGRGNGQAAKAKRERPSLGADTWRAVWRRQGGVCACGCGGMIAPFPIGYHHVFPKQRWPELIDVADNVVGVTADCHASHETAARPLPRQAVIVAVKLATTGSMERYLEAHYPLA